ncbi:MAG: Stk1 family PASTA domain-containing Ser/Thr kinase [Lachnospiraceae bacterium]|nr:Stk1 family PASTA domain-containing Ser/Thr kinase [Lachnospiraceae bacterium]
MIKAGMYISDRYEIIDKVGSGGMADVYKALCHRLNRYVAIKILKPEYSTDAGFVQKFRAEAQSVAGLSHPNIVSVYDVGEDDGLYYIVMELVEGITLKRFIEKRKKLDVKEAVGIAIQIAMGMEAAHTHHIIHRDIKPQNIIISREGKVKVADFGIAKAATSNTISQNAIGSVHYLSPEQARGGYSDERSDIYSLGVTLYEMLSGQVPFAGDNSVSVALLHIQSEAIPVRELNPEVPLSVDKIIQKCMQKKPERRYQTAAELIVDLKRSVINPEGDYVSISSNAIVPNSPTRSITEEELNTIKNAASAAKTPSTRISYSDRKIRKKVKRETEELDTMDSGLEKVLTVVSVLAAIALLVLIFYLAWNLFVKDNGEGSNGGILSGLFNENNGSSTTPTPDQATPTEGLIKVPTTPSPSPSPVPIGSELREVPRVIGLTREDAEESLKKQSPYFQITYVEEFNDEYAKDLICAQYPGEHSMVPEDKVIQLTLSVGPEMKELLDVKGRDSSSAKMLLENNDYKTEFIEEYDDVIEAGYVIRTEPEAGEMLPKGEVVRVYVSRGREIKYVECPDIVGRKQARAEKMIVAANLVVGEIRQEYSDSFDKGIVISQDVLAGSQAEEGSMVSFVVSLGSEPVVTDPPVITQDPVVTPDPGITYTPWPTQDPGGEGGQPAG